MLNSSASLGCVCSRWKSMGSVNSTVFAGCLLLSTHNFKGPFLWDSQELRAFLIRNYESSVVMLIPHVVKWFTRCGIESLSIYFELEFESTVVVNVKEFTQMWTFLIFINVFCLYLSCFPTESRRRRKWRCEMGEGYSFNPTGKLQ